MCLLEGFRFLKIIVEDWCIIDIYRTDLPCIIA